MVAMVFFISGKPSNMLLKENVIRSTITGKQKAGIFIAKNSLPVKEENNKMSGNADGNIVYEKK